MKYFSKIALWFIAVSICSGIYASEKHSIYEVISNPSRFVGVSVRLEGILCANKNNIALYPSRESCEFNFDSLGVELLTNDDVFIRREIYGHMKPVYVTGVVVVADDKILFEKKKYKVKMTDVRFEPFSFLDYEVSLVKPRKGEVKFINSFITSILNKDTDYLSEVLSIDKKTFSSNSRVNWILFESSSSLLKTLDFNKKIHFYRGSEEDGEFINFACIGENRYSFRREMKDADESTESFCFEVYEMNSEYRINPAHFGAY